MLGPVLASGTVPERPDVEVLAAVMLGLPALPASELAVRAESRLVLGGRRPPRRVACGR
jgi:hypothetical protein